MALGGKNYTILRVGGQAQIVLGSTHIVQQLSFSLFPSVLTFDFVLILGLI